jgi:acyl-CoA thioesterase
MPDAPPPESLRTLQEVGAAYADRIPAAAARRLGQSRAAELRLVDPEAFLFRRDPEARLRFWVGCSATCRTTRCCSARPSATCRTTGCR